MVIEADHRLESDSFLVAQAANGDESAYKALYERHHQHLLAVLTASMPAPIAEEAAQEAWARAYERINSLDRPQAFFAWLSTIARNYARDHHRATGSENLSLGDDHDWIPEPAPGPDTVVEQDEDRRLAARALQRLPDKQRAALLLRNLQGRSYVSIAGRLGLSVSATETLLHRARSNFQREYSSLQSGSDTPALACYKMRSSLRALSSGALSDLRRMRVIAHLESCEGCRSTQEEMRRTRRIAGFIPFFLPVAWVRDKLLHLGRGAADTAGKLAPGGGAGAGAGAAPAAIVGTMAVATLSTAAILSGIAFDVGVPFMGSGSSTDADHELVSDAASPLVFDPGIGLPPSGPGNFGQPPAGTNGIPPLGIPPVAGQFGFLDDDLLPTSDPPPGPPEAPGQQVAAAPDCITDPTLCQSDCQADPLACQPPGSPPCVDQDPNTEGCQEEPPCEDQDPNTEGCQEEPPCEDQDPNTEGCQEQPPCEDQDPNTEGCQEEPPCEDQDPNTEGCQEESPCEDQDPNTEGCQEEPPCEDQDPNTEGCQQELPCEDQDPNTEGCQKEPPCEDQDPNTEGCQPDDPCDLNPDARECQPPDPCVVNPQAEECQPPCEDQDPNTEGCQKEPPCRDQDPNTEGCQEEPPCQDQDPNTEGCQQEPPCEDQDPNTEGCQPDDPCDLNPDARECQPPDPCVLNPQAEECQPPCEDQDPNTEGCQKEPPCQDQDPNTEGCQEEPPCEDQDPNTEGCQQEPPCEDQDPNTEGCQEEPPCEDQDPNTEGCQGDSGDGGEGDDDCPGNSSNDHNCGADCDKPGQGDGNGYGHCKDNGETGGNSANAADIANDGKKEDDPGQDA